MERPNVSTVRSEPRDGATVTSSPWWWQCRQYTFDLSSPRAQVMGILNVTPDSFSDGGLYHSVERALARARQMVAEGADLIDVGGESTRPGSQPVDVETELRRVVPVVSALVRELNVPISVDTSKAEVARQALEAGAAIINDVTALTGDPQMIEVVRQFQAGVVLMHMQGTPATMQLQPHYDDVVVEVKQYLQLRLQWMQAQGIPVERAVLDPGIGFGKTDEHNWRLLAHLDAFADLGRPVLLGVSRKGFLGRWLGRSLEQRLAGSLAVACVADTRRTAQIFRVHDVAATRDAVRVVEAIRLQRRD